jgi:hypothetical protein
LRFIQKYIDEHFYQGYGEQWDNVLFRQEILDHLNRVTHPANMNGTSEREAISHEQWKAPLIASGLQKDVAISTQLTWYPKLSFHN